MCSIGAAVGGVSALSSYSSSKAQKRSLQAQAKFARQNAVLAENQSRNAIDVGRNQVEDYQRNVSAFKSSQINAMADNGLDVTVGSAVDLLAGTDMAAQADIDNLKYNAALESWGHQIEKTNLLNQAAGISAQASSINPVRNALLSGVGSYMGAGGDFGGVFKSRGTAGKIPIVRLPMSSPKSTLLG